MSGAAQDGIKGKVAELAVVFPRVDPESLEVVLNMAGGNVEKAAQFIFDLLHQQGDMGGEDDHEEFTEPTSYVSMRDAELPPAIRRVVRQSSWFARLPFISGDANLAQLLPKLQETYSGEFHCALSFDPMFVAQLIRWGYLTMAERLGPDLYVLLPKMHSKRCILQWGDVHVEKNVRKRCKQYEISLDQSFERVLEGCIAQHGEAWLYKPLRETFVQIHRSGGMLGVTLHSFELWDGEQLVAGEVGTVVGGCYTALSGFKSEQHPSSGTVQLCATAEILQRAGCAFWDLGMELPYKLRLGAKSIDRHAFLTQFRQVADRTDVNFGPFKARANCGEYLRCPQPPPEVQMKPEGALLSKSQKKKLAKLERKRERKLGRLALSQGNAMQGIDSPTHEGPCSSSALMPTTEDEPSCDPVTAAS